VKNTDLFSGHSSGVIWKAGVQGGLPAAGLVLRENDFQAFPFQQLNGRHAGIGVNQIDDAGAEKIDLVRFGRVLPFVLHHIGSVRNWDNSF
jgi:hypothetical protein